MTIGAGIVAIYAALTAGELWSERRRKLQRRWPAIVVPVLHGFVLMLPILLGDLLRRDDGDFASSIWVTVFSIELVLYAVGTVFVIFMLVSERTVTAHKTAASMDPLTGMFNRRGFAEATVAGDRARGASRPSGDGADFRHRSFQVDQRPLRPSGRRRDAQTVRRRRGQHAADHRPVGPDRRRGVRGTCCPVRWRKA